MMSYLDFGLRGLFFGICCFSFGVMMHYEQYLMGAVVALAGIGTLAWTAYQYYKKVASK